MEVDYRTEHARMIRALETIRNVATDMLDTTRRAGPVARLRHIPGYLCEYCGIKELYNDDCAACVGVQNSNFQKSAEQKREYVERLNTGWDETI